MLSPNQTTPAGEAVTFFTEDDAGQLRGVANVIRSAGGEVPDWMTQLPKERRHRKPKAPVAGGISTEPVPEGERKRKAQWRQKGKERGGQQQRQQGGGKGAGKGQPRQPKHGGGGGGSRPQKQQQGGKPQKRQKQRQA